MTDPAAAMATIAVFVYGTLRRGQANHRQLAGARWGGAQRLPGARLHDLGPFPMAIATAETAAETVQGELWWVDADTLGRLDRLEGHPRLYERQWRRLESGVWAWVYLGRPRQVRHSPVLADGRWPGDGTLAGLCLAVAVLGATGVGSAVLAPPPAAAAPDGCQAWRSSRGEERIRLANQLGAAHYLTKNRRLQTSPDDAPVPLYRESDLRRLCDDR